MFFIPPAPHPTITVLSEPTILDTGLLNMQGEKITRPALRDPVGFVWFSQPKPGVSSNG